MKTYVIQYHDETCSHWVLTDSYTKCVRIMHVVKTMLKQYKRHEANVDDMVEWFSTEKPEIIEEQCNSMHIVLHKDDRVPFYNPHALINL